ncbi:MAG: E3 ubiquitin-protein ligase bre1 [Phylliscum demangeonii]|nr:MAG: E3 ubiquitin-protein ligase bre1 [Phylliscum demangeonii]
MSPSEAVALSVPPPPSQPAKDKMDDKKRAALSQDEHAPPRKKTATAAPNGAAKAHPDADMPWKDDLERFQKDAIWRQMQEYKRERNTLEERANELAKRAAYHDDHLRIIDAWLRQLLDEVKTKVGEVASGEFSHLNGDGQRILSGLLFEESNIFQEHLRSHSETIKATVAQLFEKLPHPSDPVVEDLQTRVALLLAAEKEHEAEVDRLRAERDGLEERIENASLRYMVAEKKIDRMKSQAVAKLEQQNLATSRPAKKATADSVAVEEVDVGAEAARKEAVAVAEKQKEQIDKLEAENEKLTERVTTLTMTNLSDEDFARSELFRHMKSQHEDVITRINHLEATNVRLREEASALQAERAAYRAKVEDEAEAPVAELQQRLARAEADLARVRAARDEMGADLTMRKAAHGREQSTYDQLKELVAAKDDRIKTLESEIERVKLEAGHTTVEPAEAAELSQHNLEELVGKYKKLEREYVLLSKEFPSMEASFRRTSAVASKKVADAAALDDKMARLQAEKSKADQKYFATMKLNESREAELKTLRTQNSKSGEIIAQLKELEKGTQQLLQNLEKQLMETKDTLSTITARNRQQQQQLQQHNISTAALRSQLVELTVTLRQKDTSQAIALKSQRRAELEVEQLRVRVAEMEKSVGKWKAKAAGVDDEEVEGLRTLALCNVCRSRFKNTSLKTCGHLFCRECLDERLASRERRCPHCSKSFGQMDVMTIHL